jgi:dTDP-4-amino-4,6-dideoxygalactose transaminase
MRHIVDSGCGDHQKVCMGSPNRIYLSSPHLSGFELELVNDAFASNWIAPLGPHVDAFEQEFCATVGAAHGLAVSSGSAALHLALRLTGVGAGDDVMVSTFTFAGGVFPIASLGARPVLIDSERKSWNMNPHLLADALAERARQGRLPKAVVLVHIYGQSADLDPVVESCRQYGVALIEDAAEAVGATYKGRSPGVFGTFGAYSFNGNKIITASGGGMLVARDEALMTKARKLASQARELAPHYEHAEVGYNYRLSNILAAIGRGQLRVLASRVASRRRNYEFYKAALADIPGLTFMPEAPWGVHTRWLTVLTINPRETRVDREVIRRALGAHDIEARPVWKPMHRQPVFAGCECVGGAVADDLFDCGLCLPSGSNLTTDDLSRVVEVVRTCVLGARSRRRARDRAAAAMTHSPAVS